MPIENIFDKLSDIELANIVKRGIDKFRNGEYDKYELSKEIVAVEWELKKILHCNITNEQYEKLCKMYDRITKDVAK